MGGFLFLDLFLLCTHLLQDDYFNCPHPQFKIPKRKPPSSQPWLLWKSKIKVFDDSDVHVDDPDDWRFQRWWWEKFLASAGASWRHWQPNPSCVFGGVAQWRRWWHCLKHVFHLWPFCPIMVMSRLRAPCDQEKPVTGVFLFPSSQLPLSSKDFFCLFQSEIRIWSALYSNIIIAIDFRNNFLLRGLVDMEATWGSIPEGLNSLFRKEDDQEDDVNSSPLKEDVKTKESSEKIKVK